MTAPGFALEFDCAGRPIGGDAPPFLIAEMACAHDGDFGKACAIIDGIAGSGADAIQLQLFVPEECVSPARTETQKLLRKIAFTPAQWKDLHARAQRTGLAVFAFVYDEPSLALALELDFDGLKLNSSDLLYPEMVEGCARSGRVFTLGTGGSSFEEVARAVELAKAAGGRNAILMHGVQSFPTELGLARIRRVAQLSGAFGTLVGYADHTPAASSETHVVDLIALGLGASVLEKHVCLERATTEVDWQAALEPAEFKTWAGLMKRGAQGLGPAALAPLTAADDKYRLFQKKVIVAARNIPAGAIVGRGDVMFVRDQEKPGLPPVDFSAKIAGRKAARAIAQFEVIGTGDVG